MENNLEVGVKNALVAYLVERGRAPGLAQTQAQAKLAQAMTIVNDAYVTRKAAGPSKLPDSRFWAAAFQDLKKWSATNVP